MPVMHGCGVCGTMKKDSPTLRNANGLIVFVKEEKMKAIEKNLRASVPPVLLAQAQKAAQRQHISLDELVSDAVEERVNRDEFEKVLAFGKRHAKKRGLKLRDVAVAITAVRSQTEPHT